FTPLQTISTPHPNPPPQGGRELFENVAIVMVAGLPYEQSKQIFDAARAAGKLVNVEDMNDLCDFYFTANVKRGDLVIAVSTGGASPTLSRKIRDYIAAKFGAEWEERTEEMKNFRKNLKEQGKNIPQVLEASEIFLKEKGWLK
ncbi:MAG: NAD(P)-dependent oxidoreductase, partial [Rickettsiales bacterium]